MKLYTPDQMAGMLGLSVHTIYSKTSARTRLHCRVELPPYIRVGRLIRFPHDDYVTWLQAQERNHDVA